MTLHPNRPSSLRSRLRHDQQAEGVISTAIAVLIMAFIGVAMWVAFSGTFDRAADRTDELVDEIGSG